MKRTQVTELFANIKATFVSFFSILMFVALGVGIFVGISWASPALEDIAQQTLDEGQFHNFQIQFPYGLTDDDLAKLRNLEGVSDVEAGHQAFEEISRDSKRYTVKVQSLGERIDTLHVEEGELPVKPDELALKSSVAAELGLGVGDTITFEKDVTDGTASQESESPSDGSADSASASDSSSSSGDASTDSNTMKYLNGATYKVTALVESSEYLADASATYGFSSTPSGAVDVLAWVPDAAFNASAFQNAYPIVNVRVDSLQGINTFSDEYKSKSDEVEARIAVLGDELGTARYDDLHDQAQAKIDEAEAQLEDGKNKIVQGEKDLEEGRATLESERAAGEAQLADGYQKLVDGENQYQAGLAEYNQKKAEYDYAVSVIDQASASVANYEAEKEALDQQLEDGSITQKEYDAKLAKLAARANADFEPVRQFGADIPEITADNFDIMMFAAEVAIANCRDYPLPIDGEEMTLNEAEAKLADAKATLDYSYYVLQSGWSEYYAGQEELNSKVAEGEQMIADGEKQLADAKAQVAENEPKLAEAKEKLAEMTKYSWAVMPREYNAGVGEILVFSGVTTNLSFSMAALFIIVGLLVSYSAVSRIVHEQITQIGTKKALGLRSREITTSFLLYSAIAVITGAIIGAIVGFVVVEGIIGHVLGGMFIFGDYAAYFGVTLFLIVTLLELALVLGATYLACRGILKQHAVELLRGEKPPSGKTRFYEKWGIWDKLPLFIQTIVNNCVNDKRRVFSTVVGVAGCTALIVTALTLNDNVLASYDRHYNNVYGFDTITYVDATSVENAPDQTDAVLKQEGYETAQVRMQNMILCEPGGGSSTVRVVVPSDEASFAQVYSVNTVDGPAYDLAGEGVWMTQAYAHHLGAKVGDYVTLDVGDGVKHELPILGFQEFWLTYHELVMNKDLFEREFGVVPTYNVVLADTGGTSESDVRNTVKDVDGFYSVIDDKTLQYGNFETFSSVSAAVVAIYLALSVLMAIVVLLNLNVMFIDEKKRELIVLMINGFSGKDAKRYIYYDTIVLTVLGIIAGLVLGCIMGSITVGAIEPSTATFVKDIDWIAVLVGVIGSALLALIMSLISLRRIPRFDLTDINRF